MEEHGRNAADCRYCDKAPDDAACSGCERQKDAPLHLQGEFWGLLVAILLSLIAFVTVLMR